MSLPIIMGVAVGGIALIVLLTHLMFGSGSTDVGDEVSLAARLQRAHPEHELGELLIAADRRFALGLDVTSGECLLFYTHGSHVNMRHFASASVRDCRVSQSGDGEATLALSFDAFDRSDFVLSLGSDDERITLAHQWEERLQAAKQEAN